jgi:hypothetical protein
MQRPTPLLLNVTTLIDLWPYKSWAKGNLGRGGEIKKKTRKPETKKSYGTERNKTRGKFWSIN